MVESGEGPYVSGTFAVAACVIRGMVGKLFDLVVQVQTVDVRLCDLRSESCNIWLSVVDCTIVTRSASVMQYTGIKITEGSG